MSDQDQALQTQLGNITQLTGKSLEQLYQWISQCGASKHGEILKCLKSELGLGHGHANTLTALYLRRDSAAASASQDPAAAEAEALERIYSGAKTPLRPLHEAVMAALEGLGSFEIAPKQAYLSLRRKKQFATLGPASKGRLELGLNMKGVAAGERLEALPAGKMCQYRIFLSRAEEIDDELIGWARTAYEAAG